MSTELQRQVTAFKKANVQTQALKDGRPSIFLTASEAAAVDIQVVLEAAQNGLKVLSQYESRFEEFFNSILHSSSVDVQRELKNADVSLVYVDREMS
jgi:hypothetical protein